MEAVVLSKQEEEQERKAVLENDRSVREQQKQREQGSTFLDHTHDDLSGGRFAAIGAPTVVGRDAVIKYPAAAAHQHDPVPDEPPVGYDVNEMPPLEPSMAVNSPSIEDMAGISAPADTGGAPSSVPPEDVVAPPPSSEQTND
jgi:hypothetical protein